MTATELLDRLRARAAEFRALDARVDGARLIEEILVELEPVVSGKDAEALTISEAARRSGYSADHLGRLIRNGTLRNVGKVGAPRVLAGDLPRKAKAQVAALNRSAYSPASDARFLRQSAVRSNHGS